MTILKRDSGMRKLFLIARNDLQISLQGRMSWLFLIGIPVLLIGLVGLGARGFAKSMQLVIRIDVLDRDDSTASRAFIAALAEANEAFVLSPAQSPESARERLAEEVTSAVIAIPEGFAAALEKGNKTTVIFQPGAAPVAPAIVFAATQSVATRMGGPFVAARLSADFAAARGIETGPRFYAERLAEALASWYPPPVRVKAAATSPNEKTVFGAQLMKNGFKVSVPSIAVLFVMIGALGLIQSLTEERAAGIWSRVGRMPVTKAQLLGGKLLATFLVGWVQFALLIIFGEGLGVGLGGKPLATMAVAGAYVLAITAMALALAALARTPTQASAIATIAWLVLSMLGGAWWPLIFVPPWMRTLGHLSPAAWCLDALNALIFRGGTGSEVLLPSGVLVLFAGACFVVAVGTWDRRPVGGSARAKTPTCLGIRTLDSE